MKIIRRCLLVSLVMCMVLPRMSSAQMVVGPGAGGTPEVRVIEPSGERTIQAYDAAFRGGVNVALGDIDGDGTVDIITGAGASGGPHVRVFNGIDLTELASFHAYHPAFVGGVNVAAGDINGDGTVDIVTGAGPGGGPHVRVFSGVDLTELASFYAYAPAFPGGVTVATGDVNGDGRTDIITGAGASGGPHVRVFSGVDLTVLAGFYAYHPMFPGGVHVAAGDINGDGRADIITGAGASGGPHVRVFSGVDLAELASFYAYDAAFTGGVTVAAGDIDSDGTVDIVTGAGPGGGPHARVFSGVELAELASFYAFDPGFTGGVAVGSVGDRGGLRFTSDSKTTFTVGRPGSFSVATSGSPTPTLTVGGTLPAGVTFVDNGGGLGTLSGTPAARTGGAYPLTFTADNGTGAPVTQRFTLTVDEPPAITSASSITMTLGAVSSFTVTTTGFPVPTLTMGGVALPAGVTFVDNGDGTGTLSGAPAGGTGGTYGLTFTATNTVGTPAVQNFTLTLNGAPMFTSASTTTFTVGSAGTFTITALGVPSPAISAAGLLPAGVTFVDNGNGTGTLSGTPAAGTGGTYPITFTASNGIGANATHPFTLNVHAAPAITSTASTVFQVGSPGAFTVASTGVPVPMITRAGNLPAGLTFMDTGNGTGILSGTPAAGTNGNYALTFTATNGVGAAAVQNFILTVNSAPAFTSASVATFIVGSPGAFTVTTVGVPASALTVAGTLPAGMTFVDNGNGTGTLGGTPASGTGGTYPLTFTATNGSGSATQSFTLTVLESPQ